MASHNIGLNESIRPVREVEEFFKYEGIDLSLRNSAGQPLTIFILQKAEVVAVETCF